MVGRESVSLLVSVRFALAWICSATLHTALVLSYPNILLAYQHKIIEIYLWFLSHVFVLLLHSLVRPALTRTRPFVPFHFAFLHSAIASGLLLLLPLLLLLLFGSRSISPSCVYNLQYFGASHSIWWMLRLSNEIILYLHFWHVYMHATAVSAWH